jgi:predicted tellurium resistance membrane protein TerC
MDSALALSAFIGLFTLTILEIVLGIDNIVFVSILSGKLQGEERERARKIGMTLAIVARIVLLAFVGFLASAITPIFHLPFLGEALRVAGESPKAIEEASGISIKDLVLFGGGLFLIYKSVKEIHHKLEGAEESHKVQGKSDFGKVIGGIVGINIIFSLDSVITAVGMISNPNQAWVMYAAVILSGIFMIFYSGLVSNYVDKHPTIKILALAFLVLIGTNLMADGGGIHVPKGYTYFAMTFAVIVEVMNLKLRGSTKPVQLHQDPLPDTSE